MGLTTQVQPVILPVKGDVVDNDTAEFYDYWGIENYCSPKKVADVLNAANGAPVNVEIASNGGDVFPGIVIYTALIHYTGKVTVNVVGLAASAASVIAMAGDTVNIAPTAQLMIHKAWSGVEGNADDLEHESGVLNSIDQSIAAAYEAKTGISEPDLLQMMSTETWMNAKEAVDKGFADGIMFQDEEQPQVMNAVGTTVVPKATLNKFRNMMMRLADKERPQKKAESKSAILLRKKLSILRGDKDEH